MTVLRVAIVDDEPLARLRLRRLLTPVPDVRIVAECEHGAQLLEALAKTPVDLVFLDIDMPGRDGLAIARSLREPRPLLVFVTAYAEFAPSAFEVEAIGYLLKPYFEAKLHATLRRARQQLARSARPSPPPGTHLGRIALPIGRRMQLVDIASIESAHARENYVEVRAGGRTFLLRHTMTWLESKLGPPWFLRVHRSTLVRVAAIEEAQALASGRYALRLVNGQRVISGRSYRERVREALGLCTGSGGDPPC